MMHGMASSRHDQRPTTAYTEAQPNTCRRLDRFTDVNRRLYCIYISYANDDLLVK
eukprot:SAG31_NODE_147_length_22539_cov_37.073663_19_plen_55_part_00